jgi:hypothetical protein
MRMHETYERLFEPTKNGSLWPYVILPVIGLVIMLYQTWDLYALLSQSGRVHPNDWPVLWGMLGVTGFFAALAVALWYAPWSWATLRLTDRGLTIAITGLNARKATDVLWSELTQITIMKVPRGASYYRLQIRDRRPITIRTLALAADPNEVLPAMADAAAHAGYHLSGKAIAEPLIGRRRWQVQPVA